MEKLPDLIGMDEIVNKIMYLVNPLFVQKDIKDDTTQIDTKDTTDRILNQVPKCIALVGVQHMGTTFMIRHIAQRLGANLTIVQGPVILSFSILSVLTEAFKKSQKTTKVKQIIYIPQFDKLGGLSYKDNARETLFKLCEDYKDNVVTFIKTEDSSNFSKYVEVSLNIPYLKFDDKLRLLHNCFGAVTLNPNIDLKSILKKPNNAVPKDIILLYKKVMIQCKLSKLDKTNSYDKDNNEFDINALDFENVLGKPCKKVKKSSVHNNNNLTDIKLNDDCTDDCMDDYIDEDSDTDSDNEVVYDIIGLDNLRDKILRYCEVIFDINRPNTKLKKNLLITGPNGIGKKKLIIYISKKIKVTLHTICGSEFDSQMKHQDTLARIFSLSQKEPCIIFVRDIHLANDVKYTLSEFDNMTKKLDPHRLVIFTSNKSYDYYDIFPIQYSAKEPNEEERKQILQAYDFAEDYNTEDNVQKIKDFKSDDINFDEIGFITNNYVGKELDILCNITMMNCILDDTLVTTEAFRKTLQIFEKKEINIESPNVKFSDISGLEHAKKYIEDIIIYPLLYPLECKKFDIPTSSGIMLYGEPGCGKTLLAKAIATECNSSFISVRGPELLSSFFGETEQKIRKLFETARKNSPCVIFFDEIDAIGRKRGGANSEVTDRILTQLLTELDGMSGRNYVNVIAATNRKDQLDSALLRSGRFDKHVYIGVPNKDAIRGIMMNAMSKVQCDKIEYDDIVNHVNGFSGADIVNLCNTVKQIAFREKIENNLDTNYISQKHFMEGLKVIQSK